MVADNFTQFEKLYMFATRLFKKKIGGNRLTALSGVDFEAVGIADNIIGDDYILQMASFSDITIEKIKEIIKENHLETLVDVKNPLDINPAANDKLHARSIEILAQDSNIDGIVAGLGPLFPATQTLPKGKDGNEFLESEESIITLMLDLVSNLDKPIIGVVDGGKLYDPMVEALEKEGIPGFRSSDRAVAALAKYINGRLHADRLRKKNICNDFMI